MFATLDFVFSFRTTVLMAFLSIAVISCDKMENIDAKGGELPTNYISILDSSFSPTGLTVVAGSSITFVNNTNADKSIISTDSLTIKSVTLKPNNSFVFKKDTVGVFSYHLTNKPAVNGSFTLLP